MDFKKILQKIKEVVEVTKEEITPELEKLKAKSIKTTHHIIEKTKPIIISNLEKLKTKLNEIDPEEKNKKEIVWRVNGVTFGNRQENLKKLLDAPQLNIKIQHAPTKKYPKRIKIFVNSLEIGCVPAELAELYWNKIDKIQIIRGWVVQSPSYTNLGFRLVVKIQ